MLMSCFFIDGEMNLSKQEQLVLEAGLFLRICDELKEIMRSNNKDYFKILKISNKKEKEMIETNFIRCIINDIISTEEYTLPGVAYYTNTPEDVIVDVVSGQNTSPTLSLSQKIINLHQAVRPQLYSRIFDKIRNNEKTVILQ